MFIFFTVLAVPVLSLPDKSQNCRQSGKRRVGADVDCVLLGGCEGGGQTVRQRKSAHVQLDLWTLKHDRLVLWNYINPRVNGFICWLVDNAQNPPHDTEIDFLHPRFFQELVSGRLQTFPLCFAEVCFCMTSCLTSAQTHFLSYSLTSLRSPLKKPQTC